ncbi:MAG: ferrous iron transporter B [bacterium]
MKKILLMGNPNIGKSAVFSRLTGVYVIASNYPGTTISFTKGFMKIGDEQVEIIDVPGTYTLEPTCKAEEVACEILKDVVKEDLEKGDLVINVVDATNLERNLYLTLELMEREIPVIVALNIWDDTKHKGITIDVKKLEEWLGVPIVPTVAVTGEGFKELVSRFPEARTPKVRKHSREERWKDIGEIIEKVQIIRHRHHTLFERIQDLTVHPTMGILIAGLVAFLAFKAIRFTGEGMIGYIMEPFFDGIYAPLIMKLSALLGSSGFAHELLVGKLIGGKIDFVQSFGLLTTGLFVPFAMVLPYVISFYFVLGVLEDSGYLPRFAVLMDNIMHRVGLHGYAIIPTLLGLGCNVPGIMATRILESDRERFIASTLISIGVPCAALQAMIIGILGKYGGQYVAAVYGTLFLTWLVLGFILNKTIPGFSPELLIEIPPYRLPPLTVLFKKLWWRTKAFLTEALPVILAGIFVIDILYALGLFNYLANITAPVITGLLGLPKEAVVAIVIGFLRKDVAVGMLVPLGLTIKQLIIACVVLSMFFPCIATFAVMLRELGTKGLIKATGTMIATALIVGTILNLII